MVAHRLLAAPTPWMEGVGLHSGRPAAVRIVPSAKGQGIRLMRLDQGRPRLIPVSLEAAVPAARRTVLRNPDDRAAGTVATVEHLLSALAGCGIQGATAEIQGEEIPILDGSARPFVFELLRCSYPVPAAAAGSIRSWRVVRSFRVVSGSAAVSLLPPRAPGGGLTIDCAISFATCPAIGRQHLRYRHESAGSYAERIAPARTFALAADLAQLRAGRLARGGVLRNALIFGNGGAINAGGTRFSDEPVRHKIVDAMGDLALLGGPLAGTVQLRRCSHRLLVEALAGAALTGAITRERDQC